ncbi:MarR family transcriptional regulator [Clostridium sp. C8-1-8]|uniref:MarR family winged helix-turn-helix transcriptional regulator n=1 Tax=Clostridium sp. C8-1-8 TaxID=2698831 RepID=UPI001FACB9FE|nr:MarR family transcriptional regulator [Clostridium sp. C8-1-8]
MIDIDDKNQLTSEYIERLMTLFRNLQKDFNDYFIEKAKQYGFSGSQLFSIHAIYKNPGINIQELSKKLSLSKSTVSALIDKLVEQGSVIREIPEDNRRSVNLYLSEEFLGKFNIPEIRSQYFADMAKIASIEELKEVVTGLEKFQELINKGKQIGT